jgi:hypothetical protein
MITKLVNDGASGKMLLFWCAPCDTHHACRVVAGETPRPCWTWNGSLDQPTLEPSVRVQGTVRLTDDEVARVLAGERVEPRPLICHSFVREGRIQYLGDCTHALAGQTVPLEPLP